MNSTAGIPPPAYLEGDFKLSIENTLGYWIIASWLFCFLWALSAVGTVAYFTKFRSDACVMQGSVSCIARAEHELQVVPANRSDFITYGWNSGHVAIDHRILQKCCNTVRSPAQGLIS